MAVYTSPDVRNLSVGTGYIEFKPGGASSYYHVGNVPRFELRMQKEKLDHFVTANGIRVRDYSWTTEVAAEIEMDMEEITATNLQMLMLGGITTVGGQPQVAIAASSVAPGALRYTGTNETGPRWLIDLWAVTFNEEGQFNPLTSSEFNNISVKGSALAVDGVFGSMTLL